MLGHLVLKPAEMRRFDITVKTHMATTQIHRWSKTSLVLHLIFSILQNQLRAEVTICWLCGDGGGVCGLTDTEGENE